MKTSLLKLTLAACAAAVGGQAAFAQALDYDSLSELFGEPVTAGATGAPQRASDVPATMVIITRDDISRFPEYDIPGILRHYAGMNVTRYAVGDGQASIRGAATGHSPRLLVLVDGREVYLDTYGYTAWGALPVQLEEIQQIEVVKGPQSALYGFNAVSGVVNIITRNPEQGGYAIASGAVGTDQFSDLALVAGRKFNDRFSGRVSFGRTESDEFDPNPINPEAISFADTQNYRRETAAASASFALTDSVTMSAEATYVDAEMLESTSIYSITPALYELTSLRAGLEAETPLGLVDASLFRNDVEIAYSFGPISVTSTVFRVQDLFKPSPKDTVRLTAEYRRGEAPSFPAPDQGELASDAYAVAAMWNRRLSETVDITLAARYDVLDWSRDASPNPAFFAFSQEDYSVSYEEVSYNAALTWRPEFGGSVRLLAARGIQAPAFFDFGAVSLLDGGAIAMLGNPGLDTSVVTNYELGYDRALENGVQLRGAVFYTETTDVRGGFGQTPGILPPVAPLPTALFENRGDTAVFGAEFSLDGETAGGTRWGVNYTYQATKDDLSTFVVDTWLNFEAATPEHLVNANVGHTWGKVSADVFANYVSASETPLQSAAATGYLSDIDASFALSAKVGYALTEKLRVDLTAQNVTYGAGETTNFAFEPESRLWVELTASF